MLLFLVLFPATFIFSCSILIVSCCPFFSIHFISALVCTTEALLGKLIVLEFVAQRVWHARGYPVMQANLSSCFFLENLYRVHGWSKRLIFLSLASTLHYIKVSDLSQTEIIPSKVKKNITCFQSPPFDINKNYIMAATVCCIMLCSMGLDQVSTLFLNAQNRTSPDGIYLSFQ